LMRVSRSVMASTISSRSPPARSGHVILPPLIQVLSHLKVCSGVPGSSVLQFCCAPMRAAAHAHIHMGSAKAETVQIGSFNKRQFEVVTYGQNRAGRGRSKGVAPKERTVV